MDIKLDSESQPFMEYLNNIGPLDITKSLVDIRQYNEVAAQKLKGNFIFAGVKEEQFVSSLDNDIKYEVPVTVLKPTGSAQSWQSILIYFHGGGFTFGSRNTHMKFCEMISQSCKCVVVNVEYRLSPEHKFPACHIDAEAVARWCLDNKMSLAGSNSALVGVGGDSAGGNIAASVCHVVQGLDFQILIYPSLNMSAKTVYPSYITYSESFLLTREMMLWFSSNFLHNKEEGENPLCSPVKRSSFLGLPPALFIVSEIDPLADQSTEYHKKLKNAGVKTKLVLLKGTIHGFAATPGHFKKTTEKTVHSIAGFISKL